jgi:hypothetical protein
MIVSKFFWTGSLALAVAGLLAGCEQSGPTIVKNPDAPQTSSGVSAAPVTPPTAPARPGGKRALAAPGQLPPPGQS